MNKPHLLVADMDKDNLAQVKKILRDSYIVSCVETGEQAIEYAEKLCPEIILINHTLPDMSAEQVMETVNKSGEDGKTPFVVMVDFDKHDMEMDLTPSRAADFVTKPIIPAILMARLARLIEFQLLQHNLEDEIEKQREQISRLSLQSVIMIAQTIDSRDHYAEGHSVRVALYCREIARRLGWDEKAIEDLYYIALLHDIGNIAIEESILNKASELTEEEFEQIKRHIVVGGEMVKNIRTPQGVGDVVRYHHERYDGTGYLRIRGEDIPLVARIVSIADAYTAMTSDRAFRKKMSPEEVREELIRGKGTQFDPVLTDVFLDILDDGFRIDEEMIRKEFTEEKAVNETGNLLRQVFSETVQEAQSERERDSVTGFLNRRYFEEKVELFLRKPNACGTFFMMDLDDFKNVNDSYGHGMGDQMIMALVDVIRMNTRDGDYVCRMGGDEFAVFFPELEKERVIRKRAEDIIRKFAEEREKLECELCSVSIGIMIKHSEQRPIEYETMYNNADRALYYVKNNGKDDYHIYADIPDMGKEAGINAKQIDLKHLMRRIAERKYHHGAYAVEYDRFSYIFQFIARNIERSKQQVQIILFSLVWEEMEEQQEDELEDVLMILETAIIRSLRRGDVTTRLSAAQQIVILMDTNLENGKMVAGRIVDKFNSLITKADNMEIKYDIMSVPV